MPPLTADTITDEQIRELRRTPISIAHPDAIRVAKLTGCALGEAECGEVDEDGNIRDPDDNEIEAARTRCAEILNARAKEQG